MFWLCWILYRSRARYYGDVIKDCNFNYLSICYLVKFTISEYGPSMLTYYRNVLWCYARFSEVDILQRYWPNGPWCWEFWELKSKIPAINTVCAVLLHPVSLLGWDLQDELYLLRILPVSIIGQIWKKSIWEWWMVHSKKLVVELVNIKQKLASVCGCVIILFCMLHFYKNIELCKICLKKIFFSSMNNLCSMCI